MIRKTVNYLKEDYNRRTLIFTGVSVVISLAFGIYNGVIGLIYNSIWHQSIFIYYLLLMLIKALLVTGEIYSKRKNDEKQYIFVFISFIILFITTIAMIAPAVLLVQNKREYDWGLIPAISIAAYTTYSFTIGIINLIRTKKNENIIVKQIKLINMIAALMSILVLQNTLILANGGYNNDMVILSIVTSIGIIFAIAIIEIYSFIVAVKKKHKNANML